MSSQVPRIREAVLRRFFQYWPQLAGGERAEGAEAFGKFFAVEVAGAVELTHVRGGGHGEFAVVAGLAAGNEIAIGVHAPHAAALAAEDGLRLDVVEHAIARVELSAAIEAAASIAAVDGPAQFAFLKKIERVDVRGGRHRRASGVEDLIRQAQLEQMAALADGHDAQRSFLRQAVHGDARGGSGNARGASEASHGKREAAARLEMRVAQQMVVNGALEQAERQARHETVFDVATGLRHVEEWEFHGNSFCRERRPGL